MANGYVLYRILILSLKSPKQKNTNKIGVLPPPQSHTLRKIFEEVSSGPEINTFITDNRHLIKKKKRNTVNKCLHQLGIKKLGQTEVCAASATVRQNFCKNLTSRHKQHSQLRQAGTWLTRL